MSCESTFNTMKEKAESAQPLGSVLIKFWRKQGSVIDGTNGANQVSGEI